MQIRKERFDELVRAEILLDHITDILQNINADGYLKIDMIKWILEVYKDERKN